MSFKLWLLKRLINDFCERAIRTDDHIIADNLIVIQDAMKEIEKRLIQ
jgi:hypothetical protein